MRVFAKKKKNLVASSFFVEEDVGTSTFSSQLFAGYSRGRPSIARPTNTPHSHHPTRSTLRAVARVGHALRVAAWMAATHERALGRKGRAVVGNTVACLVRHRFLFTVKQGESDAGRGTVVISYLQ